MDEERYDIEAKCLHNTREVSRGWGVAGAQLQQAGWVGQGGVWGGGRSRCRSGGWRVMSGGVG